MIPSEKAALLFVVDAQERLGSKRMAAAEYAIQCSITEVSLFVSDSEIQSL